MRLGFFLSLGRCVDAAMRRPGRLKPGALEAFVPRFPEGLRPVARRDGNGNILQTFDADTMASEEKPTKIATLRQQDNRKPGHGPQSLLGRILDTPAVRQSAPTSGGGALLRRHVNSLRSDIGVVNLELVPTKPIAPDPASPGLGGRIAGIFRSMRTLR